MKHDRWKIVTGWMAAFGLAVVALAGPPAWTADHRDAPQIDADPTGDINDVYVFRNPQNGNTVIALTACPFLVAGTAAVPFPSDVLYQFKIENNGNTDEDLVIQARFAPPPPTPFGNVTVPAQQFTITGPGRPSKPGATSRLLDARRVPTFSGPANGSIVTGPNGIRAFVGIRDDPFFLDFVWVNGILNGRPIARGPGLDSFAGFNVCVIVVEVPPALLRGSRGDSIGVWGTTSRAARTARSATPTRGGIEQFDGDRDSGDFIQIERMGLPVANTVAIPPALKDAFNRSIPVHDRAQYRTAAVARMSDIIGGIAGLLGPGLTVAGQANALADFFLPDILPFNTTSGAGFPNGRRPQDDVITTELQVLTGNPAVTDNVEQNESVFLNDFPFFAAPHTVNEPVPAR